MPNPIKLLPRLIKSGRLTISIKAKLELRACQRYIRSENKRIISLAKQYHGRESDIAVIMLASENDKTSENYKRTIASLDSQKCSVKKIYYISSDNEQKVTDDLRKLIKGLSETYFMFARPGDEFDTDYISVIQAMAHNSEADIIYTDESCSDLEADKPIFSPDTLSGHDYMGHAAAIRTGSVNNKDIFGNNIDDLIWNIHKLSALELRSNVNCKENVRAVMAGLIRTERPFRDEFFSHTENPVYPVAKDDLVSIIIPSKDNAECLIRLIRSIKSHKPGMRYEIIVVDNGSIEANKSTVNDLCKAAGARYIYNIMPFNFSKMCNIGKKSATGNLLLFLNDDMEVLSDNWLSLLAGTALRPWGGAVSAKLLYPDESIQHIGVTGGSFPGHLMSHKPDEDNIEMRTELPYDYPAVTGACLMIRSELFDDCNGFCEEFPTDYNDIDLCATLTEMGYYCSVRPDVVLYHYESYSRGKTISRNQIRKQMAARQKLVKRHKKYTWYGLTYREMVKKNV